MIPRDPRRGVTANDNHDWWGAAPFTRRKIPLLIAILVLGFILAAVVAALIKGDGWPYWVVRSLG